MYCIVLCSEFESRESKLSKAVEVLKKRCMLLEKQIKDEVSASFFKYTTMIICVVSRRLPN